VTTKTAPAAAQPRQKLKLSRSDGLWMLIWRDMRRSWTGMLGLIMLIFFALIALGANYVAPYDPYKLDFASSLLPPTSDAIFSAD
jgi:peptide/nickel transport system permease protein